jgi:hypothetical protein
VEPARPRAGARSPVLGAIGDIDRGERIGPDPETFYLP